MRTHADGQSLLLALIIILYLICGTLWSLSVPTFETPDEPGHARYIDFLIENGRLPRSGEDAPGEAHQPPLYYLLSAAAARLAGLGSIEVNPIRNPAFRWYGGSSESKYLHRLSESPPLSGSARALHWLRLLSVALGAGTVALIYLMGSRGAGPESVAAPAAALAAFVPQFTFIAGSLNNDNLANLLSAAALACLAAAVVRPERLGPWGLAGLFAGLGLLAKFTGLVMLPCGLIALMLARGSSGPRLQTKALAFLAPALAVPLPLLARNLLVLGDPLGAAAQMESLPQLLDRKALTSSYFLTEFPAVLFRSFWGTFGWMSFHLPGVFYAGCGLVSLAGLIGLLIVRPNAVTKKLHLLFASAVLLQLAQIVVYNLTFTQAQGRFLFPVIGPIALLICSGIGGLVRRVGALWAPPAWRYLLVVALAVTNLLILRFLVVPAYHAG